jgi:hypothetical protein
MLIRNHFVTQYAIYIGTKWMCVSPQGSHCNLMFNVMVVEVEALEVIKSWNWSAYTLVYPSTPLEKQKYRLTENQDMGNFTDFGA